MQHRPTRILVPLFSLVLISCISGGNEIMIIDAWARPALQGDNSAVYFKINNPGVQADALVDAEVETAEEAEIHLSEMDSEGVMSMHHQPQVDIPANAQVEFAPGGLHLMLVALKEELNVGDTLQVDLKFRNTGNITLEVPVRQP